MGDTWLFKEEDERINQQAGHIGRDTKKIMESPMIIKPNQGAYFTELVRYIHLIPLRAKLVKSLTQ